MRPPLKRELFYELGAAKELFSFLTRSKKPQPDYRAGQYNDVLLLPGLGVGHASFWALQKHLEKHGYRCHNWKLGRNLAGLNFKPTLDDIPPSWGLLDVPKKSGEINTTELGVPYLCVRAVQRARDISERVGHPIALIGWSLGGLIAREVARELPNHVSKVITFGSPIKGGPKYTITAWRFARLGADIDWLESLLEYRNQSPLQQPIICIYSKNDGVVYWESTIDDISPNVSLHEIEACHLGMGINRECWKIILQSLKQ